MSDQRPNPVDPPNPVAALTKEELWLQIETATFEELQTLESNLLAYGYADNGLAVTRVRQRLTEV